MTIDEGEGHRRSSKGVILGLVFHDESHASYLENLYQFIGTGFITCVHNMDMDILALEVCHNMCSTQWQRFCQSDAQG